MYDAKYVSPISNDIVQSLPLYTTRIGINHAQEPIYRENEFTEYQIMQCVSGTGLFCINDIKYEINEQDIIFFSPNIPHSYRSKSPTSNEWVINWICFSGNGMELFKESLLESKYLVLHNMPKSNIKTMFDNLLSVLSYDTTYNQIQGSNILYSMLTMLLSYKNNLHSYTEKNLSLQPVIDFMKNNIDKDLSIEEVSSVIKVSPSYLCRIFKKIYSSSPIKYFNNLKLVYAIELMESQKNYKIKDISIMCGYKDPSYFCSEFKKAFNTTPQRYKENLLSNNG